MNHTKIEWVKNPDGTQGYTWNPITGCLNHTNGLCNGGGFPCYAYKLANGRLRDRYLDNYNIAPSFMNINHILDASYHQESGYADPFYPRFWEERLEDILHRRIDSPLKGIFCCDMSDLFGIGIPEEWTYQTLQAIEKNFYDRFYLLTKQPQNLIKFSPFPDNCWVGVTACNTLMMVNALNELYEVEAKIKFLSLEPLLEWNAEGWVMEKNLKSQQLDWVIIGAQTKPTVYPKIEWVAEIVRACDKAGVPVFLKDNLSDLIPVNSNLRYGPAGELRLRQEMPNAIIGTRQNEALGG